MAAVSRNQGVETIVPSRENATRASDGVDGFEAGEIGREETRENEAVKDAQLGLLNADDGRVSGGDRVADHGAFLKTAQPLRVPGFDGNITKGTNH
jgi:hypothetical protein